MYPKLEDNELVTRYPPVQGMQKDVFFLNHLNEEGGTEDSVSKFNMFEVSLEDSTLAILARCGVLMVTGRCRLT